MKIVGIHRTTYRIIYFDFSIKNSPLKDSGFYRLIFRRGNNSTNKYVSMKIDILNGMRIDNKIPHVNISNVIEISSFRSVCHEVYFSRGG